MYDPVVEGRRLIFGVSGKLYKSVLLMYDRQTESLWSQIKREAVTGPMTGARLKVLPSRETTWAHWRTVHPDSLVLSPDTGFSRDYGLNPYADYWEKEELPDFGPTPQKRETKTGKTIKPKEKVLDIQIDGVNKAYPFSILKKKSEEFEDVVGSKKVIIHFDRGSQTAYAADEEGAVVPSMTTFWFAWHDFYPDTLIVDEE